MPEISDNRFETLFSQVADAMNRAKLMVWAGDYRRAAELLDEIGSRHRQELERAENVGRSLLGAKRNRRLQEELRRDLESEVHGKHLALLLKDKMATRAAASTEYGDEEFALAVVALSYSNLRKRVLESGESQATHRRTADKAPSELPALAKLDEQSEFRCLELRKDPGRFEVRAYRPIRQDLAAFTFLERLRGLWRPEGLIVEPETHPGEEKWPIWFRAFDSDLVVEGFLPQPNVAWFECTFVEMQRGRELYRKVLGLLRPGK
jgi:hypothetical protein